MNKSYTDQELEQMFVDTLSTRELEEYRIKRGFKMGWAVHQMVKRHGIKSGVLMYGIHRKFKQKWIDITVERLMKENKSGGA